MCYHAEFGRSALKVVGTNTWEPQKLEPWNSAFLGWETWLTWDTCYHVKFGSSVTKLYAWIERNPQNWGALGPRPFGWGHGWPLKNKPPPDMWNMVVLRQSLYLSHTRTVVRECCKGNDASQWVNQKFTPCHAQKWLIGFFSGVFPMPHSLDPKPKYVKRRGFAQGWAFSRLENKNLTFKPLIPENHYFWAQFWRDAENFWPKTALQWGLHVNSP